VASSSRRSVGQGSIQPCRQSQATQRQTLIDDRDLHQKIGLIDTHANSAAIRRGTVMARNDGRVDPIRGVRRIRPGHGLGLTCAGLIMA
jgi:hypothetical protein